MQSKSSRCKDLIIKQYAPQRGLLSYILFYNVYIIKLFFVFGLECCKVCCQPPLCDPTSSHKWQPIQNTKIFPVRETLVAWPFTVLPPLVGVGVYLFFRVILGLGLVSTLNLINITLIL